MSKPEPDFYYPFWIGEESLKQVNQERELKYSCMLVIPYAAYEKKCQQVDKLIDLLHKQNQRTPEWIVSREKLKG